MKVRDYTMMWKYKSDGVERPLQEQHDRREADRMICEDSIRFYNKHPFGANELIRAAKHNARVKYLGKINKDINSLKNQLNKS